MTKLLQEPTLDSLMSKKLEGLSQDMAMQLIGTIIDVGGDERSDAALDHARMLLGQFLVGDISPEHVCRSHYFRANIWSAKRRNSGDGDKWLWSSELIYGEMLELRRAIRHPSFVELGPLAQAQIYTNLGNTLNHIGRFVEAIEYWDRALFVVPKFAMASGNRGMGLAHYAGALYDPGHEGVFMYAACYSLGQACTKDAVLDDPGNAPAQEFFSKRMGEIWEHYDIPRIAEETDFEGHSMGRGKKEREYRKWCLGNRLFINPLNDVFPSPIAARDVMTLPSITVSIEDGPSVPTVIHYFNIIKQEFCAARFSLYEGMTSAGVPKRQALR